MSNDVHEAAERLRLRKVKHSLAKTAYEVCRDGECVGYVWSRDGFSYRGTQGWNRGIRIRDFHQLEWHYGATPVIRHIGSWGRSTRRSAIHALLAALSAGEGKG